jgi:hypothetical protein
MNGPFVSPVSASATQLSPFFLVPFRLNFIINLVNLGLSDV